MELQLSIYTPCGFEFKLQIRPEIEAGCLSRGPSDKAEMNLVASVMSFKQGEVEPRHQYHNQPTIVMLLPQSYSPGSTTQLPPFIHSKLKSFNVFQLKDRSRKGRVCYKYLILV